VFLHSMVPEICFIATFIIVTTDYSENYVGCRFKQLVCLKFNLICVCLDDMSGLLKFKYMYFIKMPFSDLSNNNYLYLEYNTYIMYC